MMRISELGLRRQMPYPSKSGLKLRENGNTGGEAEEGADTFLCPLGEGLIGQGTAVSRAEVVVNCSLEVTTRPQRR